MRYQRINRFVALSLAVLTLTGPALGGGMARAQDPPPSPVALDSFQMDLSAFRLPDEAGLPIDAAVEVPDTQPPPADASLDAIAAQAAAIVAATDAADWNLGPLTDRMQYAPLAAFAFVRDSIGYDPYPGVLRGALGTLLARAGNDIDRTLLLQGLLERMVVPTRLVVGTLDDAASAAVIERSFLEPSQPLAAAPVDPQELGDVSALADRARRDYAVVRQALGDRDLLMDGSANAAATAETRQHVWLQMRFGTEWLDLDPTMPDAQPGDTLTAVSEVLRGLPDDWRDSVTIRVIAERLTDGTLSESTVLEHRLDAAAAARQDIYLAMQPVSDSLGDSIGAALGSGSGWRPALFVGGAAIEGSPFPVVPESDIFTGAESGTEFSALRLEMTVAVPGSIPETFTRTIVDRLSPALRSGGVIAQTDLTPLTMRQGVPVELSSVQHIQVSTGGFDARAHQVWRQIAAVFAQLLALDPDEAAEYGFPSVMLPMTVADESLVLASERFITDGLDEPPGIRAFIARPRVFLTSVGPTAEDGRITTDIDLVTDTIRVLVDGDTDTTEASRRQVWYGVLEGALESQVLLTRIEASGMSDGTLNGVSFGLAGPPTLLDPVDPVDTGLSEALSDELERGALAIVPGDVPSAIGWWSVEATTGATRAVLRPGTGGSNYVNAAGGGSRIFADPSKVPQTQAQLNQLYRQAVGQVENVARARPQPACTINGSEYSALVCYAVLAAIGFFVLGAIVFVVAWII